MAEEIRNRRLATEMDNLDKIDSSKIQIEKMTSNVESGLIFRISFNLQNHPYNMALLHDKSELTLADQDVEDDDQNIVEDPLDTEFSDDDPVDECEDKEYEFDLYVPKKFPFMFPELRARCDFSNPSLNDERDLLEDMLGKQWHPFIILKDIVERVPQYVYKIKKRTKEGTLYYN